MPHHQKRHEDWAIITINPLSNEVLFPNVREVLEEYLTEVQQVGFREIQLCPLGEAYVRFVHPRDRDRLVVQSPHQFGNVFISFHNHDNGRNCRRTQFKVWLLMLVVPFDFRNSEDIARAISHFGRLISWENDAEHMGRVIAKARVRDLESIPKSVRWSEGEDFDEDAWSS